ncbi:MAG: hypothetical protein KGL39_56600 [Patescibacteria group bacterium]|nr:hypothetical protein [Patescibacteria group bacterium]
MSYQTEQLRRAVSRMMNGRLKNYVMPGLSSWLVGGEGAGKVRLFTAQRDTNDWVIAPHSHRFDFTCLVLRGEVHNITYSSPPRHDLGNPFAVGRLEVPEGGLGKYEYKPGTSPVHYGTHTAKYEEGTTYSMEAEEIHTIRFSRDSMVLFFEGPNRVNFSYVLEPWADSRRVPTFSVEPWMFDSQP